MLIVKLKKYCLSISALLALKIESFLLPGNPGYKLVLAFILNFFFSIVISSFISLAVSYFLLANNYNFAEEFFSYFIISLILFSLFLVTNLRSTESNIPKIILNILFNIKFNFTRIIMMYFSMAFYSLIIFLVMWLFFSIINPMMLRYQIDESTALVTSLILAVGITLAGFFGFPLNKKSRVFNELILTPFLIIASIATGFILYVKMPISDIEAGTHDITIYAILLFIIASIIHISSYLSKVFSNLQELKKYDEKIKRYARLGKKILMFKKIKFIRFKNIFRESCKGLFVFIFENYKSKKFYIKLSLSLMLFSMISLFFFSLICVYQILVQNINAPFFDEIIEIVVKSILTLFILYILYQIIKVGYTFKNSNDRPKEERFDRLEKVVTLLLLVLFFMFFLFFTPSFFLIQFAFSNYIISLLFLIVCLSVLVLSLLTWLIKSPN